MNHDQADELRQLVRMSQAESPAGKPTAPVVVVAGGKGGVGTTTVAANLSIAFARQGRRTSFVDADLNHGGQTRLGSEASASLIEVLSGRRPLRELLQQGTSGVQVLGGHWASGQLVEPNASTIDRFIDELRHLPPQAEVVVVDAGSGRNAFTRRLWHAADAVLVVTSCDQVAMMECYAAIKALASEASSRLYTVVTPHPDGLEASDVHMRIAEASHRFLGLDTLMLANVANFAIAGNETAVFPARCEAARAMDRAADTLSARLLQIERRSVVLARTPASAIALRDALLTDETFEPVH